MITLGLSKEAALIRREVFMEEQGFSDEFDEIDARALHLVLDTSGVPAATGRLFRGEDEGVYWIGRVAVRKAFRGRALGREVMEALEAEARRLCGRELRLSAQVQAAGFYEKLGYRRCGEEYLDEHCPHIEMRKDL